MAALDFPSSPSLGQIHPSPAVSGQPQYTWDGEKWTSGTGFGNIYISDSPPAAPVGSLWWESDTSILYVRYNDGTSTQWCQVLSGPSTALLYTPQTLTAPQQAQARANIGINSLAMAGQCQLVKSGANLLLKPFGGTAIMINGVQCTIPFAGVTLAPTGLTVSTLYYIYAVATAGVVTSLEASTMGNATDISGTVNTGVEIKSGDPTRSLVGMAYVVVGPAFVDTTLSRCVRSWFNRVRMPTAGVTHGVNVALTGSLVEVASGARCSFICWPDDAIQMNVNASYYTTAAATITLQPSLNGQALGKSVVINGDSSGRVLLAPISSTGNLSDVGISPGQLIIMGLFGSGAPAGGNLYTQTNITGMVG